MPQKSDTSAPDQGVILPASPSEAPSAAQEPKLVGLDYLGGQAIIGVPARDLAASELAGSGFSADELVQTGLFRPRYEDLADPAAEAGASETETENQ